MALNVYLIRHGRTEWNEAGLLQGFGDSPLVAEGIEGAKLTGKALADVPFTACYSTMLKRAIDTANYIIGERNIPHFHHSGLNEINFGRWEGRKSADLAEHPEYILLRTDPKRYEAKECGGETVEQLYQRVTKAFNQICELHKEGNILIVSHGMTLTLLTAVLKGMHWHDFRNQEKHAFVMNTAINIARIDGDKREMLTFNDVAHLDQQ